LCVGNWYGGRDWVSNLVWPGQKGYNSQNFTVWTSNGQKAGTFVTQDNLTMLGIEAAGKS